MGACVVWPAPPPLPRWISTSLIRTALRCYAVCPPQTALKNPPMFAGQVPVAVGYHRWLIGNFAANCQPPLRLYHLLEKSALRPLPHPAASAPHRPEPCHALATGLPWCITSVQGHVWIGTESGRILVYNPKTMALLKVLRQHVGGVYTLLVTRQGQVAVWSGSNDFTVMKWDPAGQFLKLYSGHTNGVRAILHIGPVLWTGSSMPHRQWPVQSLRRL